MHNFVNTCVNFKLSWIDQCCISDTSDDRHSGSLNQMSIKSVLFLQDFRHGVYFPQKYEVSKQ